MSKNVFVTGATGYIGGRCANALAHLGYKVRCGTRRLVAPADGAGGTLSWFKHGDQFEGAELGSALAGCDTVLHFAGLAHVPETPAGIAQGMQSNVQGTANLATASAMAGIKRFIFISSALALSGARDHDGTIHDTDIPKPLTAYARSKVDAEDRLKDICRSTGMEWVILRPPMVYGPVSRGNFHLLLRAVDMGLPLPLGSATAPKSVIYVDNLISAVRAAVEHPDAGNHAFLIADLETTSTAGLVHSISLSLNRRSRLIPVPETICRLLGQILGRQADIERLFEPLKLDTSGIQVMLGWRPQISQDQAISMTVQAWRNRA